VWRVVAAQLAVVLVALVLAGWGSGVLVVHVFATPARRWVDVPVNRWFYHHRSATTARLMGLVTRAGSEKGALGAAVVIGGTWSWRARRIGPARALAIAYAGAVGVAFAVKVAVGRGRPAGAALFASAAHLGYPSGHATLSAAVYGTTALLLARDPHVSRAGKAAAVAWGAVAVVVGFSRLYLGRHYLTEVLAGSGLGSLWALAVAQAVVRPGHHDEGGRHVAGPPAT
jgi:undecaprenyl-diphosphatase